MKLIILTGLPCSGKSYRAQQIAAGLNDRISSDPQSSKRTVLIVPSHHASSDSPYDPRIKPQRPDSLVRDRIYNSAAAEKTARAEEFSAIKRAVSRDTIVIADGLNYIKGYRYQLWCEAKAAGTRCCVVHVAAQEDECRTWNRERLRAWGNDEKEDEDALSGMEKQAPGKQGHDILGDLVPESHTAVFGDRRVVENLSTRSRSSSMRGGFDDDNDDRGKESRADDAMTLKSLHIDDRSKTDSPLSTRDNPSSSLPRSSPARAAKPSPTIPVPPSTSALAYSPSTLLALSMRYEPPSPFSRWDTPLFTVPSSDATPPVDDIWTALFPPASQRLGKKALSQQPRHASSTPHDNSTPSGTAAAGADIDVVKPHAATVLPQATASDALQTLESATMDVVRHILQHLATTSSTTSMAAPTLSDSDGHRSIPLSIALPTTPPSTVDATLHVPASAPPLTQPLLQRLRRKYTQLQRGGIAHGQGYVRGRRQVVEGFVAFLEHEWNEDEE